MEQDFFQHKANSYDKNKSRVTNVDNIANTIKQHITFTEDMHILDFGSGTGLLLERIAPLVKKITAVDVSPSMNEQLAAKRESLACDLAIHTIDLSNKSLNERFDGIITSMTMHHIQNIPGMFARFHDLLNDKGFIAIADLDSEDGSFHTEDTGVFHCGFERSAIQGIAQEAGFTKLHTRDASIVEKPQGNYSVFMLAGYKNA